ncbi:24636_t:CDS:2, partial [Entrophospora sp. SA101]
LTEEESLGVFQEAALVAEINDDLEEFVGLPDDSNIEYEDQQLLLNDLMDLTNPEFGNEDKDSNSEENDENDDNDTDSNNEDNEFDEDEFGAAFVQIQLSLWGNATDLSLLTNLTHDDISNLQNSDSKNLEKYILDNNLKEAWNKISNHQNMRIDFILDNAGFELYGDLIFADWLIQSGHASEIHLHVKKIPWFVSDTTEFDFKWLLNVLKDSHFFSSHSTSVEENNHNYLQSLTELSNRWEDYLKKQIWVIKSDWFWTSPYSYWHIKEIAPDLFNDLKNSSLIIFKGDLNYRKLVYDCKWPTTTSFKEAIGPLANEIGVPSILALRTSKADVIVGLPDGLEEHLNNTEKDWMYS